MDFPDDTAAPMTDFDTPVDEQDEQPQSAEPAVKRRRKGGASARPRTRTVARKDAESVLDLFESTASLDADTLGVFALLLGVEADPRSVTLARLGTTSTADLAGQVIAWHSAGELEASLGVMEASESRAGLAPVWAVLEGLGAVSGSLPRSRFEATRQIVTGVLAMSDDDIAPLRRIVSLGK